MAMICCIEAIMPGINGMRCLECMWMFEGQCVACFTGQRSPRGVVARLVRPLLRGSCALACCAFACICVVNDDVKAGEHAFEKTA